MYRLLSNVVCKFGDSSVNKKQQIKVTVETAISVLVMVRVVTLNLMLLTSLIRELPLKRWQRCDSYHIVEEFSNIKFGGSVLGAIQVNITFIFLHIGHPPTLS